MEVTGYFRNVELVDDDRCVISIDPGVLDPLFCILSTYEKAMRYGSVLDSLRPYQLRIDRIRSVLSRARGSRYKRSLRMKILKLGDRIRRLRKRSHIAIAQDLCRHSKLILLPMYRVSQICNRRTKRSPLSRRLNRRQLSFGFFAFTQTLEHVARKYDTTIIRCNEAYTSSCCYACLNGKKLVGHGMQTCTKCDSVSLLRDCVGACNIMTKCLVDFFGAIIRLLQVDRTSRNIFEAAYDMLRNHVVDFFGKVVSLFGVEPQLRKMMNN